MLLWEQTGWSHVPHMAVALASELPHPTVDHSCTDLQWHQGEMEQDGDTDSNLLAEHVGIYIVMNKVLD